MWTQIEISSVFRIIFIRQVLIKLVTFMVDGYSPGLTGEGGFKEWKEPQKVIL